MVDTGERLGNDALLAPPRPDCQSPAMISAPTSQPLVGISACRKTVFDDAAADCVVRTYSRAVAEAAGAVPLVVPALGAVVAPEALLGCLDGLVLTGSPSNVHPDHYGGPAPTSEEHDDLDRDATTLPMIRAAIRQGVPLLGICRGIQELNVALGGTLHPEVHRLPDHLDHRADTTVPWPRRFRGVHSVTLAPGGLLARELARETLWVNSLHQQGIDRLAPPLVVEATAPDGLVEAVRHPGAAAFTVAVQWHPEWPAVMPLTEPEDQAMVGPACWLFRTFAAACRARHRARCEGRPPP